MRNILNLTGDPTIYYGLFLNSGILEFRGNPRKAYDSMMAHYADFDTGAEGFLQPIL